ncbi:peptidoglycan D,D-transpeptidase FtsI family protein [Rubrobacter aplysinae]|uniref:peptidoglycan D,D-transpeptidase FtsI family protein n=1 Tax=Rubrobacter aplysinae TaxID=909625 RepID=UPI00069CFE4F|nr:penicillin-binding transpeptidase domain-containing protein [Rubrobacter aplysinae]
MNVQLRRVFYLIAAGFVALVLTLAYWQVYAREEVSNNPKNSLQAARNLESPRGLILARDGETVLADSVRRDSEEGYSYDREYPEGAAFSNIIGYSSVIYGQAGVEARLNSELTGSGDPQTLDELINQSTGGPRAGNNVELTIDSELQQLAYDELSKTDSGRGSLVAFEPDTGDVLALVTYPSYDPAVVDQENGFAELQQDEDLPLINRATQALYPPGSTFKTITASAGLKSGLTPKSEFFDSGEYPLPGFTIRNYKGEQFGEVTLREALVESINVIFSKIAVDEVGPQDLAAMARAFGFGDNYDDFLLPVVASTLGSDPSTWVPGNTAPISFGQEKVGANVFEMAMVAATIANDGDMMEPRLVKEVRSSDGVILDSPAPKVRRSDVISEEHAGEMSSMMQSVVDDPPLGKAQISGVEVAGKTGTAEAPPGDPHSWWISFAPTDEPEIAVAAMVENGGELDVDGNADIPAVEIGTTITSAYLDAEAQDAGQSQDNQQEQQEQQEQQNQQGQQNGQQSQDQPQLQPPQNQPGVQPQRPQQGRQPQNPQNPQNPQSQQNQPLPNQVPQDQLPQQSLPNGQEFRDRLDQFDQFNQR